jgi:hypothetical protein
MPERLPLGALIPRAIPKAHPDAYPLVNAPRGLDDSAIDDPVCARDHRATTEGGLR